LDPVFIILGPFSQIINVDKLILITNIFKSPYYNTKWKNSKTTCLNFDSDSQNVQKNNQENKLHSKREVLIWKTEVKVTIGHSLSTMKKFQKMVFEYIVVILLFYLYLRIQKPEFE